MHDNSKPAGTPDLSTFGASLKTRVTQVLPAPGWVAVECWPGRGEYCVTWLMGFALAETDDMQEVLGLEVRSGDSAGLTVELTNESGQFSIDPDHAIEFVGYFPGTAEAEAFIKNREAMREGPGVFTIVFPCGTRWAITRDGKRSCAANAGM